MSAFIHDPGPHKFTIEKKDGTKYVGECYSVSINTNYNAYEKVSTTINFSGHRIRVINPPKKKKASKKKAKKKSGK